MLFKNWSKANRSTSHSRRSPPLLALACLAALLGSGQALAQDRSCNSDIDMTVLGSGPFFLDEALRVSADIGAGQIRSGTYLEIPAFGFALNCHIGQGFANCTSEGNTVEFLGNMETNCLDSAGNPVELVVPESNVIPMTTKSGLPIRTPANTQCNVQFDIAIRELAPEGDRLIVEAMGWPIAGFPTSTCDNGLTSSASATMGFQINECGIELDKQVSVDGGASWSDADAAAGAPQLALGQDARYRLVVTNTGSVAFNAPIAVVDAALGINTTIPALAAGASTTVTSAQIPALLANGRCQVVGSLENESSVEGVCRGGADPVSSSASDSAFIECVGAAAIDIEKATNGEDADTPTGPLVPVGNAVTWTYIVTNTGTLALNNVAVTDDQGVAVTCPKNALAVGESMTCTAAGAATAGQYANLGSVTADSAGGSVSDSDPSHYFGSAPSINIVKTAAPTIFTAAGESITYTFVVTNTGNGTLTAVTVTDPLPGLGAVSCDWVGSSDAGTPASTLSVGETVSCSAPYTTTQDDVNAGRVDNVATARGTPPVGPDVTDTDPATISSSAEPSIEIVKEISIDGGSTWHDANTVGTALVAVFPSGALYRFTVTNDGTVALKNVEVDDPDLGIVDFVIGNLDPGEVVIVTSGELPALEVAERCDGRGTFTNNATASGASVSDDSPVSDVDAAILKCIGEGHITLKKEISPTGTDPWFDDTTPPQEFPSDAWYRFTVTNDGTAPLENVEVLDGDLSVLENIGSLAVGETVVLTSGEVPELFVSERCTGAGDIANTASVSGNSVDDPADTVDDSDTATLVCVGTQQIEIVKEISIDNANWSDANTEGAALETQAPSDAWYRITVRNVGSVDLVNVVLNDGTLGIFDFAVADIPVGGEVVLTSGEIAALFFPNRCEGQGTFGNTATASGESAETESTTSDSDQAWLECTGTPAIQLVKEISVDGGTTWSDDTSPPVTPPSDAWYRLTVTNTGTADLENVVVNDATLGIVNFPVGNLLIGQSVVLDDGDIPALFQLDRCTADGLVVNTASAAGTSVDFPFGTANDSDDATLLCEEQLNICEDGKPDILKVRYDGDSDTDHDQGLTATIVPPNAIFPAGDVYITVSDQRDKQFAAFSDISVGESFNVEGPQNKIPSTMTFRIFTGPGGGTPLQTVTFHTSCSLPLNAGDEFGAITVVGGIFQ